VTDHQRLDLPVLQESINTLLGKASVHPSRIPACVEQYATACAIRGFRLQQSGKASGIVGMQVAEWWPGNPVLIDIEAACGVDVIEHLLRVKPARLRDTENPKMIQNADVDGRLSGAHDDNLLFLKNVLFVN
jgi:hypothetical protein